MQVNDIVLQNQPRCHQPEHWGDNPLTYPHGYRDAHDPDVTLDLLTRQRFQVLGRKNSDLMAPVPKRLGQSLGVDRQPAGMRPVVSKNGQDPHGLKISSGFF
jgi:hypothetical protein